MRKPCNRPSLTHQPLFLKYYLPYHLYLNYAKAPGTDPGPYPHTYDHGIPSAPPRLGSTLTNFHILTHLKKDLSYDPLIQDVYLIIILIELHAP